MSKILLLPNISTDTTLAMSKLVCIVHPFYCNSASFRVELISATLRRTCSAQNLMIPNISHRYDSSYLFPLSGVCISFIARMQVVIKFESLISLHKLILRQKAWVIALLCLLIYPRKLVLHLTEVCTL